MAPRPLQALSAAALALIAALALTWATASAQEPTVANTGTTLHPGANLIGWVGETAPVSQLFRDIPQLEAVWAWDAELDDWIVAGRNVPEGLGWLWQVSPGMGLYMILNGDQPFLWQRSTEPTRGLVELRTGWNLVAWSGADQTPINDATKGIGWSLREVRRHNAETQQWTAWTSPERTAQLIATAVTDQSEETETPTIQHGEALWINVARSVHWLQPTDILPRLVFPGGASDELQARVREDLESVLAFYRTQYGIQADPDFTVYIPKDVDSLIQALNNNDEEPEGWTAASIRAWWDKSAGWAGDKIVVKQDSWPEDLSTSDIASGRYTLTHEYFHILQSQMSDNGDSQWLVEGTADWGQGEHESVDGGQTVQDLREQTQSALSSATPSLRSAESENNLWEYTLGWLATDQLTDVAGPDSWLEFWRRLTPTETGSHGRWVSTPDWQTAFNETFGITVPEFYREFDAQQREWAAENGASANSYDDDVHWIRGRVTDESDAPVVGVFVNAIRIEDGTSVGWDQQAETDTNGTFAVRAPEDGNYRLSVVINDNCFRYYNGGQLTDKHDEAQLLAVAGSDLRNINIRLQPNICGWQIQGQVLGADGEPLAGISVRACGTDRQCTAWYQTAWYQTAFDGAFTVPVETEGEYRLHLKLSDGCDVYHRSDGGATLDPGQATVIEVTNGDNDGVQVRIPSDLCRWRVSGSIAGIERFLDDGYVHVNLCRMTDSWCRATIYNQARSLDRDGSFAFAVPTAGTYRLEYYFGGCTIYHGKEGLTSSFAEAMRFDVGDRDVRINHQRMPDTMCAYQISGRLVSASGGAPIARVLICHLAGNECATELLGHTDGNGRFAVTVPADGRYRVVFFPTFGGCPFYYGEEQMTADSSKAWVIDVAGEDVRLPQRLLPAGLCDQ